VVINVFLSGQAWVNAAGAPSQTLCQPYVAEKPSVLSTARRKLRAL
jgi:hypothetical protein